MSKRQAFNFVGGYAKDAREYINPQNTLNMYELSGVEAQEPSLVPMPGYVKVGESPRGTSGRRLYVFDDYMYGVFSNYVYRFDEKLVASFIGELDGSVGFVNIRANTAGEIMFLDGISGWIYDTRKGEYKKIATPDFLPSPLSGAYQDGRFIVGQGDSPVWGYSALNNGLSWDAGNRADIESRPDKIVGMETLHRDLYIFGNRSTEVWNDAGNSTFAYVRSQTMIFEYGCAAIGTIKEAFGLMFFLSKNDNGTSSVMMSSGGPPQSVTPPQIETEFSKYQNVSDASAYIYKIGGHIFYVINFTKDNVSWAYDLTTRKWFLQGQSADSRHLVQDTVFFKGKHYGCLYNSNQLVEISSNYYDFDSQVMVNERISDRFFLPSRRLMRVNRLEVTMMAGIGSANGIDKKPFVELLVSKDGGRTYSHPIKAYLGKIGENLYLVKWENLGIAKEFVFKFRNYNSVYFTLLGGTIDIDEVGQ